jgi:hypothetical protein
LLPAKEKTHREAKNLTKHKEATLKPESKAKVRGLPVIRCECGQKILLVPDAKVMGEAIDVHVELHKRKVKDAAKAEGEAERIRDILTGKVLDKASHFMK